ncbi:hypothetical protein PR048_009203 [Dryococelus australis]|uniref:Uncharacterized protein n=1 Tax=Dryococelus australis TaxID=614101 RepID=A0ABQ9HZM2_9NEOP|nr:hypothetical protein PR048_009203 [Dryococelus australis]
MEPETQVSAEHHMLPLSLHSCSGAMQKLLTEKTKIKIRAVKAKKKTVILTENTNLDKVIIFWLRFQGKVMFINVGKLLSNYDNEGDYKISYLRKSHKTENKYHFLQEPDVASINKMDIVMTLPSPQKVPGTKRRNSYLSFSIN